MEANVPKLRGYAPPSTREVVEQFNEFVKYHDKEIAALQREIARLKRLDERRKAWMVRSKNRELDHKHKRRKASRRLAVLEKEVLVVRKHDRFFAHPFSSWSHWKPVEKGELMVRAIVAFHEMEKEGKIDYNSFLILVSGIHISPFCKEDIKNRYGVQVAGSFKRIIKKYTELGYVKKINRKDLYFLTEKGKEFITGVVKAPMGLRLNNYYGGIFDGLKGIKRHLPSQG